MKLKEYKKLIKTRLAQTLSLILTLVLVVSSLNWKVNAHYCGDQMINFSLIGEAEGCGMPEESQVCDEPPSKKPFYKGICCENKDIHFSSNDIQRQKSRLLNGVFNSNALGVIDFLNEQTLTHSFILSPTQHLWNPLPPWLFFNLLKNIEVFRI